MSDDRDDYEVGYRRPPRHSQFKKGQSGNPRGRPRMKSARQVDVDAILDQPMKVRFAGKTRRVTAYEATMMGLVKNALSGKLWAIKEFIRLCENANLFAPPKTYGGFRTLTNPPGMDYNEWRASIAEEAPDE